MAEPFSEEYLGRIVDERIAALEEAKQIVPFGIRRRSISDEVFRTVEHAQELMLEAEQADGQPLPASLEVPQYLDDQKVSVVKIPTAAGVVLTATSQVALDWKEIQHRGQFPGIVKTIVDDLLSQIKRNGPNVEELVRQNPVWRGPLKNLADEISHGSPEASLLSEGLPLAVTDSNETFTIDVVPDRAQQIEIISRGILNRIEDLCDEDRQKILRQMAGWRGHVSSIKPLKKSKIARAHDIYESVLIRPEELVALDSRFSSPDNIEKMMNIIQDEGRMLNPLHRGAEDDEIVEGKEEGQVFCYKNAGDVVAFYNMLYDRRTVIEHMKDEWMFDPTGIKNVDQLTHIAEKIDTKNGHVRKRSVTLSDRHSVLKACLLAQKGQLVWSVDQAVQQPTETDNASRLAGVATALKMIGYGSAFRNENKQGAALKIFKIDAIDARETAKTLGIPRIKGKRIKEHDDGLVRLPRPLINKGSRILNTRLGAYEILVVDEDIVLPNGVRIKAQWVHYLNPFPPDDPSRNKELRKA